MRKIIAFIMVLSAVFSINAMGGNETRKAPDEMADVSIGGKSLAVYFSVMEDGLDSVSGASRVIDNGERKGSNEYIAGIISSLTGADLFAIETVSDYPRTHNELLSYAYSEKSRNERPQLRSSIEGIDRYSTVFLIYPNWNADLPMPLYTFLESYDLSGKTIVPFVTHGGSGFSRTVRTIESLEPGSRVLSGLSIPRDRVSRSRGDIEAYLKGLGY